MKVLIRIARGFMAVAIVLALPVGGAIWAVSNDWRFEAGWWGGFGTMFLLFLLYKLGKLLE